MDIKVVEEHAHQNLPATLVREERALHQRAKHLQLAHHDLRFQVVACLQRTHEPARDLAQLHIAVHVRQLLEPRRQVLQRDGLGADEDGRGLGHHFVEGFKDLVESAFEGGVGVEAVALAHVVQLERLLDQLQEVGERLQRAEDVLGLRVDRVDVHLQAAQQRLVRRRAAVVLVDVRLQHRAEVREARGLLVDEDADNVHDGVVDERLHALDAGIEDLAHGIEGLLEELDDFELRAERNAVEDLR
mmetsp:Transcript_3699/g.13066  ORF Transcript_3699/g.13066 Transcript_3699/m.13066 type:complete len:245 (+) Transcript_3699:2595-3329(+)